MRIADFQTKILTNYLNMVTLATLHLGVFILGFVVPIESFSSF